MLGFIWSCFRKREHTEILQPKASSRSLASSASSISAICSCVYSGWSGATSPSDKTTARHYEMQTTRTQAQAQTQYQAHIRMSIQGPAYANKRTYTHESTREHIEFNCDLTYHNADFHAQGIQDEQNQAQVQLTTVWTALRKTYHVASHTCTSKFDATESPTQHVLLETVGQTFKRSERVRASRQVRDATPAPAMCSMG